MADDQTIRDLTDQLEDLVRTLNATASTGRADPTGGFDRGVKSLVNAMAKMTAVLKGQSMTRREESKFMRRFTADVERNTKAQEKQAAEIERRVSQQRQQARQEDRVKQRSLAEQLAENRKGTAISRQLYEQLEGASSASQFLRNQFYDLSGSSKLGQAGLRMLGSAASGTAKALNTYASSVYKGEIGAANAARALKDFVEPITSTASALLFFGSFFTPGGWVVKGLMRFGAILLEVLPGYALKLNETAAEQADALFKSFREISAAGVNFNTGMDGVFETLQTLGMSTAEIAEFNRVMADAAKNVVFFGATAGMGAQEFAKVAGGLYKSELGRNLELLGITAADQREAALMYMTIQARTGQLQLKNTDRLIKETGNFAKELDLAAQLTGQTRREQAQAREAALAEPRLRSAIIAERSAAEGGDIGAQQRLARLERASQLAAIVGRFDPRAATGIRQAAAGGGALTTPEAVAAEMTYGINRVLSDPNMPLPDALRMLSANAKTNIEALAGVTRMTGTIEAIQTDVVGAADFYTKLDATIAAARDSNMSLVDYLESLKRAQQQPGSTTELMTDAARMDQGSALLMQRTVNTFTVATDIYSTASKGFSDAVQALAKIIGVSPVPGGVPGGVGGVAPTSQAYIDKVAQLESGNRNIPTAGGGGTSSAYGLYQITRSTFEGLAAQKGSALAGRTFEQMQTDVGLQRQAMQLLTDQNTAALANAGVSTTDAAKYLAHVLGAPTAIKLLKARGDEYVGNVIGQQAISNNPNIFRGVGSVIDLKNRIRMLTGSEFALGGIASGPRSGYSAVLHGTEAVVPLPDGKTIPVTMPDAQVAQGQQIEMMSRQLNRLDDIVTAMREQIAVSNKILRVQQA